MQGSLMTMLSESDEQLQKEIDDWHREHPGANFDRNAYKQFLQDIGIRI